MTALSNLVNKLDRENPEILKLFPKEYVQLLIKKISNKELKIVKDTIEKYVKDQLGEDVINYKLYSYKTLKGITAEILIQPTNTSVIIQYALKIEEEHVKLIRLR